ncbi:MAG: thioredoxin domain-containing protein [Acidobacteriota bacterium]
MRAAIRSATGVLVVLASILQSPAQSQNGKANDTCDSGQPNAPVKIEIFSDFQCPACRAFYLDTIRPILKEYASQNRVCIVYHDFPLQMHSYARPATRYAIAARRLGRDQWLRVCEALYTDQALWTETGKLEPVVARVLSSDEMARIKKILEDPTIEESIEQAIALAVQRGIRSTPTFFINANGREQRVVGGVSYPILKDYLERLFK